MRGKFTKKRPRPRPSLGGGGPRGRHYAYVVNLGDGTMPGTVSEYAIGAGGALTLIDTTSAGPSAFMIATTY